MKITRLLLSASLVAAVMFFTGCGDDDGPVNVGPLAIVSVEARGTNPENGQNVSVPLNAGSPAVNIPFDAAFVITFSKDVDAATTNANITLSRGAVNIPVTVTTAGAVVTVTPNEELDPAENHTLTINGNVRAADGGIHQEATRTFITFDEPIPEGLVAWWRFENNANDLTGAFNGDAAIDITYVDGRNAAAGKAAQFNGTTSIIEIPNGTQLTGVQNLTINFWMRVDPENLNQAGAPKGYFVFGLGGFHGFQFEMPSNLSNSKLVGRYARPGGTVVEDLWADATGNLGWQGWTVSEDLGPNGFRNAVANNWSMITISYNGATKIGSIYLNGELIKRQDFNLWPEDSQTRNVTGLTFLPGDGVGTKLAIGFYCDRSSTAFSGFANYANPDHNHFKGALDDMRIYHRALSDQEVGEIFEVEKP